MSDSKAPSGPAPYGVSILSLIHRATPSLGPVELKDDVGSVTHIYVVEHQTGSHGEPPVASLRQIGSLPRPDAELYAAARTQLPPLFRELHHLRTLDAKNHLTIGFLEAERDDLRKRLEVALENLHGIPSDEAPLDLEAIEARECAATEGPWVWVFEYSDPPEHVPIRVLHTQHEKSALDTGPVSRKMVDLLTVDAEFIAHTRTDVPALCREVRRLRALLEAKEA